MGKASRRKAERRQLGCRCLRCERRHDRPTAVICSRCRQAAIQRARSHPDWPYACYDYVNDKRSLSILLELYADELT